MKILLAILWVAALLGLSACDGDRDPMAGTFPGAESHEWR